MPVLSSAWQCLKSIVPCMCLLCSAVALDATLHELCKLASTTQVSSPTSSAGEAKGTFSGAAAAIWLCTFAGNTLSAAAHCITAVIGAGVLALPYSVAALGWAGGPVMITMFAVVSLYTSMLLSDVYRYPGPDEGKRNRTYMACVKSFLGKCLRCDVMVIRMPSGASR